MGIKGESRRKCDFNFLQSYPRESIMTLSGALQSGVSSLNASSARLQKTSENIANSSTIGYKRGFADFVTNSQTADGAFAPSAVRTVARATLDAQGGLLQTSRPTDLAIVGDGYFIVGRSPSRRDEKNFALTRAGSFTTTAEGFLRNSAGNFLFGYRLDDTGKLSSVDQGSFRDLKAINIREAEVSAQATTSLVLAGNLPADSTGSVSIGQPFLSSTEIYTPLGAAARLTFQWSPSTTPSQWTLTIKDPAGQPLGSVDLDFYDSGPLAGSVAGYSNIVDLGTAPAGLSFDPATGQATLSIDNGMAPQTIILSLGGSGDASGITQFAGDFTIRERSKNGSIAGILQSVEIGSDGMLFGLYDTGLRRAIYQIPLADVPNRNAMLVADGATYLPTKASGSVALSLPNSSAVGVLQSGYLERSTVDLAEELIGLIETQRSYASSAKIITGVDSMLEETTGLKR